MPHRSAKFNNPRRKGCTDYLSYSANVVGARRLEFLKHIARKAVGHAVVQCSIAILALGLIAIFFDRLHLNLATVTLLYVIVIVLLARVGNFLASVVSSIFASLLLAYIAPPNYSFRIDDPLDAVAVAAFLITSFIIARLVSRLREMSEEALASVNRKLIDADERVRSRIGKELHDDIEQRLALLAVEVAQLSRDPSNRVLNSINGIREQTSRIAADVQALAYELRPYKLEYLGIAAAMKSYCEKFGELHNMEIHFTSHDLPNAVSLDASLSLVRVLQEALHNAAKHSGASHVEAELFGASEAIHLAIHDSGIGFNPEAAMQGPGLGLISMRERLKLVNGEFSIDSQPRSGSTIQASVPLPMPTKTSQGVTSHHYVPEESA
jgi:signal transduction histidine kinase